VRDLCAWFDRAQRDLPWRRTRDPYAIWISEAMLQQTRVETVIPYWRRFLERFPDLRALAAAPEDSVVAAWSGLGYYRRARALREAARALVERHAGGFPRTRDAWLALPGVGPYTAGAVLSIAFDEPEPLVDGNVLRVFARLFAIAEPIDRPATVKRIWARAAELVPRRPRGATRPRNWNQALMELGATVCLPREPNCGECPVRAHCAARAAGRTAELPIVARRASAVEVELEALLVRDGGRVLLQRRPADARMARMWELPTRERVAAGGQPRLWPVRYAPALAAARIGAQALLRLRHAITTHRITLEVRAANLERGPALGRGTDELSWVREQELDELALTGMTRKALARLERRPLEGARAFRSRKTASAARTPR